MGVYKVTGYGRVGRINIEINKYEISHFTKTRVYFDKNRFENREAKGYSFPHKWFKNKQEALKFMKEKIIQELEYLKSHLKKTKEKLRNINDMLISNKEK